MKRASPLVVYLKKDIKNVPTAANFEESIVNALKNVENSNEGCENEVEVYCNISKDGLVLSALTSEQSHSGQQTVLLRRPPFCPIKSLMEENHLMDLNQDIKSRGVAVGVSILLESVDKSVLLTRRAGTMRTFPHVWVPPGGHVDKGEGLLQAGIRELQEETGIRIEQNDSTSIIGMWESSYPPMTHLGPPRRHHIVVYVYHRSSLTAAAISKTLRLEVSEVDACTWLCSCVASKIVATDEQFTLASKSTLPLVEKCHSLIVMCVKEMEYIDGIVVERNGMQRRGRVVATSPLFAQVEKDNKNERVSTGTKYALKLWLDRVNPPR